jgi:hypothetical protein
MKSIGGLFGRSPYGPLHEHMAKVQECVEKLPAAVEFFLDKQWDDCKKKGKVISKVEHEADVIKQSIRAHLSNSIFSPVKRSEILLMLKTQDAVADRCEEVAGILTMRETPFPDFLKNDFILLISKVVRTANLLTDTTRELNRLSEDAGSDIEKQMIIDGIDDIHMVEHEADIIEEKLKADLFKSEKDVDPVTIMILLDLFKKVGHIADAAENVSDAIRCWLETM